MTRERCLPPEPGVSVEEQLEKAQADGRITAADADEVHNFAAFLRCTAGIPRKADDRTPEQQAAFIAAYREHYPDAYARAVAERGARRGGGVPPP